MRKELKPLEKVIQTVFGVSKEVELTRCSLNISPDCTGYSDGTDHYAKANRDRVTDDPISVKHLRGSCKFCYNLQCKRNRDKKKPQKSNGLEELMG